MTIQMVNMNTLLMTIHAEDDDSETDDMEKTAET